jgi:26S proteasome regulatory subunit N9
LSQTDTSQALEFLQGLLKQVDTPTTREAYLPSITASLSKASKELDQSDNIPSNIYSSFYRVSGDLAKSKADYVGYYKNSLLYLACLDIQNLDKTLNKDERIARSRDLGIAALLGETIYNFGELLMHPIIEDLKDSQYKWLYDLLLAFNAGSLGKFESLLPYVQQEVRVVLLL